GLKTSTEVLDFSSVEKTYQALQQNYDGELDTQKMIEGASRGLVSATGDPYTVFMDAKESEEFNKDLSGNIGGGIGAEIGVRASQPTIIRVLVGNPAEKAGLKAGDVILAVNDQSAANWTADKAVSEIRGDAGTTVKLTVARGNETKEFTITREVVNNPSVQSVVQDGIGVLTISRFDQQTGTLARQAAESFKRQGVRGVILDLRGNGGGYLDAAQDVVGLWLDNKIVVSERVGDKVTEELRSGSNSILDGMPTVVLVNGSSASASEIVAGALQDYKKATLIGEKTFGKGSVQKMLDLGGGATLKVTVARWYTPNGKNITKEGIAPDQAVELTAADADAGKDPQLDAAKAKLSQ
ncbi:MAG TPA: S41 family peptidase, partial [Candidatus Saccharimonadales bacterium]|nr:S41 family peptidase [Candidatus Saccharimonadales bacterium]